MTKHFIKISSLILILVILSSCGKEQVIGYQKAIERGNTINIAMSDNGGIFNPLFDSTLEDSYVNKLMFDRLVEVDSNGDVVSGLADFTVDNKQDKFIFKLKDVNFSNGTKLTAEDVLFTMKILCDPSYAGIYDLSILKIKGVQEYNEGTNQEISGIKALDEKTIEFSLSQPNPSFIFNISIPILSKDYYEQYYSFNKCDGLTNEFIKPMGTGQYIFVSHEQGSPIVLESNKNYFKGAPKIENINLINTSPGNEVLMLMAGESDMTLIAADKSSLSKASEKDYLNTMLTEENGYSSFAFNCKNEILSDKNVRQALAYAINRKEIMKETFGENAGLINIHDSVASWTYTNEGINTYEYNLQKAEEILDKANWVKDADGIRKKDGKKLTINFVASQPNPTLDVALPVLKDDFKKIGVDFVVESVEFNTFVDRMLAGQCDMWFFGLGLTIDPSESIGSFTTDNEQNFYNFSNKELDKVYLEGYFAASKDKKKQEIQKAYKILNDELPSIPFYQRKQALIYNTRVEGLTVSPYRDCFDDFYLISVR